MQMGSTDPPKPVKLLNNMTEINVLIQYESLQLYEYNSMSSKTKKVFHAKVITQYIYFIYEKERIQGLIINYLEPLSFVVSFLYVDQ